MSKIKELQDEIASLKYTLKEGRAAYGRIEMKLGGALFGYSEEGYPLWGELTPDILVDLAVRVLKSYEHDLNRNLLAVTNREVALHEYTCSGCAQVDECPWSFDLYNTHGDCLAEK